MVGFVYRWANIEVASGRRRVLQHAGVDGQRVVPALALKDWRTTTS
jgi:hypothetical protein